MWLTGVRVFQKLSSLRYQTRPLLDTLNWALIRSAARVGVKRACKRKLSSRESPARQIKIAPGEERRALKIGALIRKFLIEKKIQTTLLHLNINRVDGPILDSFIFGDVGNFYIYNPKLYNVAILQYDLVGRL